ncbi:MAG: divergent polysaccharide deacetylase family protein [Candidatus Thiodiazotropha sp. (ex Monitilora ramsayi)]|nr:divergent polysaccharide deacetylase family protein [Candidatus Thiodiazotropha sp. (ex Monitilora ramsayi)]
MRSLHVRLWLVLTLMIPMFTEAETAVDVPERVRIALIIDDLGNQEVQGKKALALPGAITYAFLPQTPFAWQLASDAHRLNKEVMLHLPMESDLGNALGAGALTLEMSQAEFLQTLKRNLASIPFVAGVNNHMGSLLTRDPTAMRWLMNGLREAGLFFIDSRTTDATVAERVARNQFVATARRHVFLDNVQERDAVRAQLTALIDMAREQGSAIGIGHPYPETLAILTEELPKLEAAGIELVPASSLVNQGSELWHASSSPSHKAAKNSKPLPSPIY